MNPTAPEPSRNPQTSNAAQEQFSGAGNHSQVIPPVNLVRPADPLRWHEVIHRHPEIYEALFVGWSGPNPRRLARLHRQRLGKHPYGGWQGQPYLYEAADVARLAQLLATERGMGR